MTATRVIVFVGVFVGLTYAPPAAAQPLSQRGFVEARAALFPRDAANDPKNVVGDARVRYEAFATLTPWLQLAGGINLRANTYDQVADSWVPDLRDRVWTRPPLSVRRLSATIARGPLTVDLGRQFIRWGKADIVTPTDRFAPRDFLDVVNSEYLGVTGARATWQENADTFEVVWVPVFTPSRIPLLDQRWTAIAASAAGLSLHDGGALYPERWQGGLRWSHNGSGYEYSASFFDGFNHLPNIGLTPGPTPSDVNVIRQYPRLRMYGGDAAVPSVWFTAKGEAAYFTSPDSSADDYVLYVVQLERQTGEWLLTGGYAGEAVTKRRISRTFSPDRDMSKSIIARASYTIDPNRSAAIEAAVRENAEGLYTRAEYSWATGQHWRTTLTGALLAGTDSDFIGQYRRNSHVTITLRYSY